MHGDFTRTTFRPEQTFRSVLLQQGRVLLDAEWNEQAEITAHHDETRTIDVVGRSGGPAPLPGTGPGGSRSSRPTAPSRTGSPWTDLVVTGPGTYYVDGILAEALDPPAVGGGPSPGWRLVDQPHLPAIGAGAGSFPACPSRRRRTATGDTRSISTCGVTTSPRTRIRRCSSPRSAGRTPRPGPGPCGRCAGSAWTAARCARTCTPRTGCGDPRGGMAAGLRPAETGSGSVPDHHDGRLPATGEPALPGADPHARLGPGTRDSCGRARTAASSPVCVDHQADDDGTARRRARARPPGPRRGAVDPARATSSR